VAPPKFGERRNHAETGTVGWDPSFEYNPPVQQKLFILYLFVVLGISIVKLVRLVRQLRWLRRNFSEEGESRDASRRWLGIWDQCVGEVQAAKRWVVLTWFLSLLFAADQAGNILGAYQPVGIGALSGGLARTLGGFAGGMFVCAVVYAAFGFCEGTMSRRQAWRNSAESSGG
jgi:hypothetical protein